MSGIGERSQKNKRSVTALVVEVVRTAYQLRNAHYSPAGSTTAALQSDNLKPSPPPAARRLADMRHGSGGLSSSHGALVCILVACR